MGPPHPEDAGFGGPVAMSGPRPVAGLYFGAPTMRSTRSS